MFSRVVPIALAAFLAATVPLGAQQIADDYPSGPIRIIVCVPAGGGVDTATRIVADRLRQKLGQPVIVENRGGQAGNIGAEAVANARPDGYTLLAAQPAPLTINGILYKKLNYEPAAFEQVAVMTAIPNVLLVRSGLSATTVQEFITLAKNSVSKLNYASQGNGTTSHLTAELFQRLTSARLVHVPYRGTAPALNDLVAGHVDLMFVEAAVAIQQHNTGKARILAVATEKRIAALPDIPTFAESGIDNFESSTWNAIAAPPGTPHNIAGRLNQAINDTLAMPDVRAQFLSINMQPVGGSPADMAKLVNEETKRWGDVIAAAGITIN